uniref:Uncharacterized protein n=1 Tax=Tetranychus urticae TaxID=32264 RepID=T1K561_TETUR
MKMLQKLNKVYVINKRWFGYLCQVGIDNVILTMACVLTYSVNISLDLSMCITLELDSTYQNMEIELNDKFDPTINPHQ